MKQHYSNRSIINNSSNHNNTNKNNIFNVKKCRNVIGALSVRTRCVSIGGDRDKAAGEMEDKFKWIISNDYRFPVCLEDEQAVVYQIWINIEVYY